MQASCYGQLCQQSGCVGAAKRHPNCRRTVSQGKPHTSSALIASCIMLAFDGGHGKNAAVTGRRYRQGKALYGREGASVYVEASTSQTFSKPPSQYMGTCLRHSEAPEAMRGLSIPPMRTATLGGKFC